MNPQTLNLFIVDNNQILVAGLRNYLDKRFAGQLNIFSFYSGKSALKEVDGNTSIVILDYTLEGENGNSTLESIKNINPKTEVIMLTSNEDIGIAIESYCKVGTEYVVKGENTWEKISGLISRVVMYPVKVLVQEMAISKYLAMFFLTFTVMAIGTYLCIKYIH